MPPSGCFLSPHLAHGGIWNNRKQQPIAKCMLAGYHVSCWTVSKQLHCIQSWIELFEKGSRRFYLSRTYAKEINSTYILKNYNEKMRETMLPLHFCSRRAETCSSEEPFEVNHKHQRAAKSVCSFSTSTVNNARFA